MTTRTDVAEHENAVWRVRLLAGVVLLTALALRQSPGLTVPDTKLDLTADPWGFLGRALHVWDPHGAFGQLQNQAYGYLFPVGPFHGLLVSAGVPDWLVQRLWWAVVMSVAFLGLWRLAGALGVGTPGARYLAALVFAVSPRMVSEVAVTSVEVWPYAVAPWVLVPLVDPRRLPWRRRVLRSALAVTVAGGVNAVATGAVLVLPTVWFLTRRPARAALVRFGTWLGVVVMASLWWLVPLVVLGRHSPPFLDWIEDAGVTTSFAGPFEALRGTTTWLSWLRGPGGPSWPAGWEYVTSPALVAATTAVAVAGLVGLRRVPEDHRRFLGAGLLVGLLLVTLGHTGTAPSPAAGWVQDLLDGPFAALRNTHKFELVVRVPLALGLAETAAVLARHLRGWGLRPWLPPLVAGSVVAILAAPAVAAGMARPEGRIGIPDYWYEAARWLDARPEPGTVLVVPAASFADHVWGSTKDEPLQALLDRPFAVRDAVPLGSAGATRWLDLVERRLQAGDGDDTLRSALARAGVRFVVVRNDLRADVVDSGGGQGLFVHEALTDSGLARVAEFGPPAGPPPGVEPEGPAHTTDQRTHLPYPSVEVYEVEGAAEGTVVPADRVVHVVGGAEDVPDALAAVPGAAAAVVGTDVGTVPDPLGGRMPRVVTDGNLDTEVFFGRPSDNRSQVLAPGDPRRTGRSVDEYVADPAGPQTRRQWTGGTVRVSSSASDAPATLRIGPGAGPQALVDGDPATAWVSGTYGAGVGEWVEVRLDEPVVEDAVTLTLQAPPRRVSAPREVRVDTDAGTTTARLVDTTAPQRVPLAPGPVRTIRITVTETDDGTGSGVAIAELDVPGVDLGSTLVVPPVTGPADALVLRRPDEGRSACAWVVDRPLCTSNTEKPAEDEGGLRRDLDLAAPLTGAMTGTVAARPGPSLERLLDGVTAIEAEASSRATAEPAGRPAAAADGDLGTGWVASPADEDPTLTLRLPRPTRIERLQLLRDEYLAASRPSVVGVSVDGGPERRTEVDDEGFVEVDGAAARTVRLHVLEVDPLRSTDAVSEFEQVLPVGISEVVVPGVDPTGPLAVGSRTGAECGFGPDLVVGDRSLPTRVEGTVADVLRGAPLRWSTCGDADVRLPAGPVRLEARSSGEFTPRSLTVEADTAAVGPGVRAARGVRVERPDPAHLTATVDAGESGAVLVVHQNHDAAWTATGPDGSRLEPVRVDGWQQGWVLPPGARGEVVARYEPDVPYRWGLGLGAVLALLVLVLAWVPGGRPEPAMTAQAPAAAAWNGFVAGTVVLLSGAVGAVAVVAGLVARGVSARTASVVAGTAGVLAAVLVSAAPSWPEARAGVDDGLVQLLVLVAVVAASGAGWSVPRALEAVRSPRRPRRINGRSKR
ncbi:DUF3367 domain-containing protein [Phycicoccus sp. CSK15P-2]|uniref:alpha-(1->3)-arabinofuranosyltransferase domain-containing protein n=1 Tax=Phycicoccus sp. CSK15P-2 TaxID=2807627 RepID=UPI00194E0F6E|nr:alpha-(1->3)-arabinofuranosyltransferase family protein [Phycicoccus sp. CSK15P-2]MBM6403798.1 DUF3367 domain-containing protein [Phycicoccus sp. CSK15P-2]